MVKNVVPNDVIETSAIVIQYRQSRVDIVRDNQASFRRITQNRREGEDLRFSGIHFEIDGNTSIKNTRLPSVCGVHSRFTNWLASTL